MLIFSRLTCLNRNKILSSYCLFSLIFFCSSQLRTVKISARESSAWTEFLSQGRVDASERFIPPLLTCLEANYAPHRVAPWPSQILELVYFTYSTDSLTRSKTRRHAHDDIIKQANASSFHSCANAPPLTVGTTFINQPSVQLSMDPFDFRRRGALT